MQLTRTDPADPTDPPGAGPSQGPAGGRRSLPRSHAPARPHDRAQGIVAVIAVGIACATLLAACGAGAARQGQRAYHDAPGTHHAIRVQDLPPPALGHSSDNAPIVVPQPAGATLQVPEGFRVNRFASGMGGLNSPRTMAIAPNGDVFAVESGGSRVVVLRDTKHSGKADRRFVFATHSDGLSLPFGIAFHGGYLYVASTDHVQRFAYRSGQTRASGPGQVIIHGIPAGGYNQHWTRDIAFSADGSKLYLTIGSRTNDDADPEPRASIYAFNPDGSGRRRVAWGIRNPVGLAIDPASHALWTTVNERDKLGDDLVPDYFTAVRDGGFYGWPWFYLGAHVDPRHRGQRRDLAGKITMPDVLFQAHSAALGCCFYTGKQFPAEYRGDAFAAFHGSWNRRERTGYKIVRVHFRGGKPAGGYDDFLTGWMLSPGDRRVWGRPVGVTVAADGSLLVSDDGAHCIWRVSYTARLRAQPK